MVRNKLDIKIMLAKVKKIKQNSENQKVEKLILQVILAPDDLLQAN